MSETTQPQPLPFTITGEEYVKIRQFLGQMSHDAVKPLCDFFDGKQHQAQQMEAARLRAAEVSEDPKPAPKKK